MESLARAGGLSRGRDASHFLSGIVEHGWREPESKSIPDTYWSVTSASQPEEGKPIAIILGVM